MQSINKNGFLLEIQRYGQWYQMDMEIIQTCCLEFMNESRAMNLDFAEIMLLKLFKKCLKH